MNLKSVSLEEKSLIKKKKQFQNILCHYICEH